MFENIFVRCVYQVYTKVSQRFCNILVVRARLWGLYYVTEADQAVTVLW